MISRIAIRRICEDKLLEDEDYRRLYLRDGRLTLEIVRQWSDDKLVAELEKLGSVTVTREWIDQKVQRDVAAWQIADTICHVPGFDERDFAADVVWFCLTCLWRRWFPDRPGMEMVDDYMQEGYKAQAANDDVAACRLWKSAWQAIVSIMEACHLHSIRKFDQELGATQSVFNWVQNYESALFGASRRDPQFVACRLVATAGQLQAELIVNGSFENGTYGQTQNPGSTDITGWEVVNDELIWFNSGFGGVLTQDGNRSLDLTGFDAVPFGGVKQTIATTPGTPYELSFYFGTDERYSNPPSSKSKTTATIGGVDHQFESAHNGAQSVWEFMTQVFTATSNSTEIVLFAPNDANTYVGLDNVSVEALAAVPEPSTFALLGMGAHRPDRLPQTETCYLTHDTNGTPSHLHRWLFNALSAKK